MSRQYVVCARCGDKFHIYGPFKGENPICNCNLFIDLLKNNGYEDAWYKPLHNIKEME